MAYQDGNYYNNNYVAQFGDNRDGVNNSSPRFNPNDPNSFAYAGALVPADTSASPGDVTANPYTSIFGPQAPGGTSRSGAGVDTPISPEFGFNQNTFDLVRSGVGSISDLMKTFLGFKTLSLAKDQLQTNKDQFNQNFTQQTAAANDRRLQYNQTNDAKRRFIQGNSANKDTSFLRDLVPA